MCSENHRKVMKAVRGRFIPQRLNNLELLITLL